MADMGHLIKIRASFFLIFSLLLLGALHIAHSFQAYESYLAMGHTALDIDTLTLNDKNYTKHVMFDIATTTLGICAFISVLIIRKEEKGELETEMEQEKVEKLEAQMKADVQAEISKAKESFLVMFTHELKTPLNAIINFSSYMSKKADKLDEKKIVELSNVIYKNGYSMLDTINNLLEVARVKNGKISSSPEDIALADLVGDIFARYKILADEKGVTSEIDIDKSVVIRCDRFHLEHIVANLYTNAIKYGKGKISIGAEFKNKDCWSFFVEDNGDGISDANQALKLYEQIGEDGMRRHAQGTGVGLYFCKLLVDALGLGFEIGSSQKLGGAKITIISKDTNDSTNS